MDILSHGLYGGIAVGRKSRRDYLIAFFFGIAPDLFSFGPYFLTRILGFATWSAHMEPPSAAMIPSYVHALYNITHSFVVYAVFFFVLWWLGKRTLALLTLGWPLHILVDIPTHSEKFFPTPFLWPASHFHVDGVSWGQPMIFIPNVLLIISLYAYWYYTRRSGTKS
jgi:membrane-bound metal-dependent hydrolase YbcI (DUF457 family)